MPKLFEAIMKAPECQPILLDLLKRAKLNIMINAVIREVLLATQPTPLAKCKTSA